MACPFFEPRTIARFPQKVGARLPLLDEYEGLCLAMAEAFQPPDELRFRVCNHGYGRGSCPRFPTTESRSCARFDVRGASAEALELLLVEEQDHAPVRWQAHRYYFETERLEPDLGDRCIRAQALAFCRSYTRRFFPRAE